MRIAAGSTPSTSKSFERMKKWARKCGRRRWSRPEERDAEFGTHKTMTTEDCSLSPFFFFFFFHRSPCFVHFWLLLLRPLPPLVGAASSSDHHILLSSVASEIQTPTPWKKRLTRAEGRKRHRRRTASSPPPPSLFHFCSSRVNPAACCWSGVFSSSTNSSTYSSYTTVSLDGRRRTKPHLFLSLLEYQMRCTDRKLALGGWWVCFMLSVHFQAPHGCNINETRKSTTTTCFRKTMVKNWSQIWTSQQPQQTTQKLAKTPSQRPKRKEQTNPKPAPATGFVNMNPKDLQRRSFTKTKE